jgi:predicted Zn-dependent peptidase
VRREARAGRRALLPALLAALVAAIPPGAAAFDLESRVREHRLANGMHLIIVPRPTSPVVSLVMKFRAGAVDEEAGRSGMAHLLEHMLFKGTRTLGTVDIRREEPLLLAMDRTARELDRLRREAPGEDPARRREEERLSRELAELQERHRELVVKDEIDGIYHRNGAQDFNAFTDPDLTTYRVDLPANRLELWASIESDRMANPVLREFYAEREVVREERRQSYDSQPSRLLWELFLSTAFQAHPYRRPIIGWPSDIAFLERGETESFFRRFYSPANTVVAVVGDVEPDRVLALLEHYFGPLPATEVVRPPITGEPPQRGERRAALVAEASPSLLIGWHKPTLPHRDDYVLDLVDGILASGRTSRLHRLLVEEKKLASSVGSVNGLPGARYDNLFAVTATPLAPHLPEELEPHIYAELERLGREPVGAEELEKVRKNLLADFVRGLDSNSGLANMLAHYQAVAGDWRYLLNHARVMEGITTAEIMETAARTFRETNRTVATLRRAPAAGGEEGR